MQKSKFYILVVSFVTTVVLLFASCDQQEIIDNQKAVILTWLTANRITYDEVVNGVYRNITNPEDGVGTPNIENGDLVTLSLGIYRFSSGFAADGRDLIYTNIKDLIPEGVMWSDEPLEIVIGSGQIMAGVEKSLIGAAPGDVVTVLMTSNNAYGDNQIQQMPKDTPVAWIVQVVGVLKNR